MVSGVFSPFFSWCHCNEALGASVRRLFVTETRRCAQNGHPCPIRARCSTFVSHSWSSPCAHFHHTRNGESGVNLRASTALLFFVGCNSLANAGYRFARLSSSVMSRRVFFFLGRAWGGQEGGLGTGPGGF
eukprot:3932811-Rhodomonas_salina.1